MKLLIIDDSQQVRSTLLKSISLIPQITTIFQAQDIEEGIKLFSKHLPEIVILDLMLKSATGIDFLKAVKTVNHSSFIILYSSFLSDEYIKIAKDYGVEVFFDKTTDILELVKIIQEKIKFS